MSGAATRVLRTAAGRYVDLCRGRDVGPLGCLDVGPVSPERVYGVQATHSHLASSVISGWERTATRGHVTGR